MAKNLKSINEMVASMKARKRAADRARREAAKGKPANDDAIRGVSSFTAQHGDYESYLARTVNRGGTAIARWKRDGLLTESQEAAILHCQRLWQLTDTSARLVANLDRTIFGSPGDGNMAEIEARQDIHRIRDYFRYPLDRYFDVFENVCRFDEPAGVAGSGLANNTRSAVDAARVTVCFIADTIFQKERLSY